MRTHSLLSCLYSLALFTAVSPAFAATHEEKERFSVPFFVESNSATQPSSFEADFTLQKPAILDSIYIKCAGGNPTGGLVTMDGGPAGVNGTTGVAGLGTGLVVGPPTEVFLDVLFTTPQPGVNFFSATNLGRPVKSKYQVFVFLGSGATACFGNAVFVSFND